MTNNDQFKPNFDKAQIWRDFVEALALIVQHSSEIAAARKTFYNEYLKAGFTESQALELCKEILPR